MRIVSWNIEMGRHIDRAADVIAHHPDLQGADVIFAQEMSTEGTDDLASRLGMHAHYHSAASHKMSGHPFGNAVLSRSPLRDCTPVLLPHKARIDGLARSALFATVQPHGDGVGTSVLVASAHIETVLLSIRRRSEQIEAIADFVRNSSKPVVIGGDFNSASSRSRQAFESVFAEAGLSRLSGIGQETFRRFGRPFVLDHFFGRGVTVVDSGVVAVESVSDHEPIWVELSIEEPAS